MTTTQSDLEKMLPSALTLSELERLLPGAEKAATTFEKSPVWEPAVGEAILGRVKRVIKTQFELPMVIFSETAKYQGGQIGSVTKGELRLPTWAVARAKEQTVPVKFVEGLVYFVKKIGEKDTGKVNPYIQAVVLGPWPNFPVK